MVHTTNYCIPCEVTSCSLHSFLYSFHTDREGTDGYEVNVTYMYWSKHWL